MVFQRLMEAIGSLAIMFLLISHAAYAPSIPSPAKTVQLAVYKSSACGCCEESISHQQPRGLKSTIHHPDDLNAIKNGYWISPKYHSCHTADFPEKYVLEGHILSLVVPRFLAENSQVAVVPRMPVGSSDIEIGERFTPYDVLLLKSDGSSEVYLRITRLTQTFKGEWA